MARTKTPRHRRTVADSFTKERAEEALVELFGLIRQSSAQPKTVRIPSELLEPVFVHLIGSAVQGALSEVRETPVDDDWGPTVYRGTTMEKLHSLQNRINALCSFASQVGAVHASMACNNLLGKVSSLIRLERQEPGSVVKKQREIEQLFEYFAKTGKLPPKKTKGRKPS